MAVNVDGLRLAILDAAPQVVEIAAKDLIGSMVGLVWDWNVGGDRNPFPPHLALNGSFGASEGAFDGYFPGDHDGCRCETVDVKSVAEITSVTGTGDGAVATITFAEGIIGSAPAPSVDFAFGGYEVTVVGENGQPSGWSDLMLQIDWLWAPAVQSALDGYVIQ